MTKHKSYVIEGGEGTGVVALRVYPDCKYAVKNKRLFVSCNHPEAKHLYCGVNCGAEGTKNRCPWRLKRAAQLASTHKRPHA